MATTPDRIKVNDTLTSLDVQAAPEPYRFGLPGNKVITFPDPGEMDWNDAEKFMEDVTNPQARIVDLMKMWLSEEDFQTLLDAHLTLRQMLALFTKVGKHYGDVFGTLGEGVGSANS